MHPTLSLFIRQYLWVVCAALVPVIITAFMSIPMSLGNHPGEPRTVGAMVDRHMS
ncbi:hypothetical protein [Polaromonas sp.]|uniref:hypothetical protein n=1 Tax=Polaromonas sp. TaxID=1869339 RepID=UPI0013BE4493|nr:hypothetical protein [Polaromonas sp.]NDP64027.1 hypothetical protein [Polaromonas sp.]